MVDVSIVVAENSVKETLSNSSSPEVRVGEILVKLVILILDRLVITLSPTHIEPEILLFKIKLYI